MYYRQVFLSTRPNFLILAPLCVFIGLAYGLVVADSINFANAAWVLVGCLSAHISVNCFNEYFDFSSGLDALTDKTPFSGGSGSLPDCPEAKNAVLMMAVVSLLLTIVIGLMLLNYSWLLLPIGMVGVAIILLYTQYLHRSPWLCLIAPGLAFGPLVALGSFVSIVDPIALDSSMINQMLWISLVPFFLTNNLLLLNQLPDVEADKQVGRRTFPIVYGFKASCNLYLAFVLLTALLIVISVAMGLLSTWLLASLLPLSLMLMVFFKIKGSSEINQLLPYLGLNVAAILATLTIFGATIFISSSA